MSCSNANNGAAGIAAGEMSRAETSNMIQEEQESQSLEDAVNLATLQLVGKEKRLLERAAEMERESKRLRVVMDRNERQRCVCVKSIVRAEVYRAIEVVSESYRGCWGH